MMRHDMILYFLLFFYILQYYESHSIPTPLSGPHDDLEWTNASLPFLKKVYSAADYSALLINRNLLPIEELVRPTTLIEKQCSLIYDQLKVKDRIPSSVYDVPKDIADNASELDALTRITDLVVTFNESNRVLVLIGDSLTRNSLESLECILKIENGFDNVIVDPPILLGKVGIGATMILISIKRPGQTVANVTFRILFLPIYGHLRHDSLIWSKANVVEKIFSDNKLTKNMQVLYAANIGMHEKIEARYRPDLKLLFHYAESVLLKLGQNPAKNKFLYRETSAQHFNLSCGYYNEILMKTWGQENPGKQYQCVPSAVTQNVTADWRHHAECAALENQDHIHFIPFHNYSRHYYDIHPFAFHSGRQFRGRIDMDCTHFVQAASPVLFRILWHSILMH